MKKTIVSIVLLLCTCICFGQSKLDKKLFEAVSAGDSVKVEKYLKEGGNPNVRKGFGFLEMQQLILAVQNKRVRIAKLLIDNKADVNFRDAFKSTPLMYAAHSGNIEIVRYLVENGADVKADDGSGNDVLSAAKEGGNAEVIAYIEGLKN